MHEFAVTRSMLDIVIAETEKAEATRVTEIHLAIGEISSIIDNSVQAYFDAFSRGSIAEGAILKFNRIKPEFICNGCGYVFIYDGKRFDCPVCGETGSMSDKGQEFYIERIIVE